VSAVAGLLLAAGAGRRMGGPKALLRDGHGVPFLDRSVGALLDGGCAGVTVVLGADAEAARALLDEAGWTADDAVQVVLAPDWASGMGASLRAGLAALEPSAADVVGVLVSLVDLPAVGEPVVRRLLDRPVRPETLARASYDGRVGHPVLIGRAHWAGVTGSAGGDRGARDYLAEHRDDVELVECADLATGRDVDHPTDL
jgi:CTP:molybdopterin cytidylyltransferase MocA